MMLRSRIATTSTDDNGAAIAYTSAVSNHNFRYYVVMPTQLALSQATLHASKKLTYALKGNWAKSSSMRGEVYVLHDTRCHVPI